MLLGVIMIASASVMAETVSFSYGTNFFSPSQNGFATSNGRTTVLEWTLDSGITFGVVNEQTTLDFTNPANAAQTDRGLFALNGIRLMQKVIDRVQVGIGLGYASVTPTGAGTTADTASVVDILGEIKLFSGEGKKVEGALVATVAARYMNTPNLTLSAGVCPINDMNGTNMGLAVKIGF